MVFYMNILVTTFSMYANQEIIVLSLGVTLVESYSGFMAIYTVAYRNCVGLQDNIHYFLLIEFC